MDKRPASPYTTMPMTTQHTWIDSKDQLPALADALARAPWIALDTEGNSMFVYRERVCLVQLNVGGEFYVIDPLALEAPGTGPSSALEPLRPALEDPAKVKFLHGGEYDVATLKRDYGIRLAGVWDSQQAATFLGWERTGYGAAVEKVCQVKLEKAYSQHDWGRRPIEPEPLTYALDDVVYLPQVCQRLQELVREADLEEEVAIANRTLEEATWSGGFDPAAVWHLKDARSLDVHGMKLLLALHQFRDEIARELDRPSGMLINDRVLVAIAGSRPDDVHGLKRHGLRASLATTHGERMLGALRAAIAAPPKLPDQPPRRESDPLARDRDVRLRDWRRVEATRRKVPPQVVLPPRALEWLKVHGAADLAAVPQFGEKRARLYGAQLREVCGARDLAPKES